LPAGQVILRWLSTVGIDSICAIGVSALSAVSIGDETMAVPKSKITKSRRGMRRSHDRLKGNTFIEDQDSGELRRPHHVDLKSGMYRGRQILEPSED